MKITKQKAFLISSLCVIATACSFNEAELSEVSTGDTSETGDASGTSDTNTPLPACNFAWPQENFDDNQIGNRWSTVASQGFSVNEENSVLRLNLGEAETWSQAGIRSTASVDFTNKRVLLKIIAVPKADTATQAHLSLFDPTNDGYFSIVLRNENLSFIYRAPQGGSWQTIGSTVYDSTEHVYWQLRHQGNSLIAETSADLISFTELGSEDINGQQNKNIENADLYIRSVTSALVAAPGEFVIDELNVDPNCN